MTVLEHIIPQFRRLVAVLLLVGLGNTMVPLGLLLTQDSQNVASGLGLNTAEEEIAYREDHQVKTLPEFNADSMASLNWLGLGLAANNSTYVSPVLDSLIDPPDLQA